MMDKWYLTAEMNEKKYKLEKVILKMICKKTLQNKSLDVYPIVGFITYIFWHKFGFWYKAAKVSSHVCLSL